MSITETTVSAQPRTRVRALNTLLLGVEALRGVPSFEHGGVLADAVEATGLRDLGDDTWHEGFAVYVDALEREASLNAVGRRMARSQLIHLLSNRLLMTRDLKAEPAITTQAVTAPLIIVGLPRSGTTILQHLLGEDIANRSLLHWEAWRPSPPPAPPAPGVTQDPRRAAVERGLTLLYRLAPEARSIHPQRPDVGTECATLLANSFASFELATMHRVPSYLAWLLDHDLTPHYREHRRQLQLLQWRWRRDRWVLKCPAHLFAMDALLATYPDARIVNLHREPREVLPSFCSLAASLQRLTSTRVDLEELGRTWLRTWATGVERNLASLARLPASQLVDLHYRDLVADPLRAIEGIYRAFDLPLTSSTRERMATHLEAHPRDRGGGHQYTLEQFGLTEDEVRERFAPWYARWG